VPHLEVVRAVVDTGNLPEFEGVQNEGGVALFREPDAVVLIGDFAAWKKEV